MHLLKKLAVSVSGTGPNRAAAFRDVVTHRSDQAKGVHQPELFDGLLSAEAGDFATYTQQAGLLKQSDETERIDGRHRYQPAGIAPGREKILYTLSTAAVVGTDGIVYCPRTRMAVDETMRCWRTANSEHALLSAPRLPAAKPLSGCGLNIALLSGDGFYHFLIEALPRLWLARSYLPVVAHIFANGGESSFHARWLSHAGVLTDRVIWMTGHSHFLCEQLLFANYIMGDYQPTPWIVRALRELLHATPPTSPGRRKLWISRSDATTRSLEWEADLLSTLPGFEKITLSLLSPAEQIQLMHEAAVVAGPHGAGLANLVFCAPGTKVIEIFPDGHRHPAYARIADVCHLSYTWAVVDFVDASPRKQLGDAINRYVAKDR
jgi:hypothetical protein